MSILKNKKLMKNNFLIHERCIYHIYPEINISCMTKIKKES